MGISHPHVHSFYHCVPHVVSRIGFRNNHIRKTFNAVRIELEIYHGKLRFSEVYHGNFNTPILLGKIVQ